MDSDAQLCVVCATGRLGPWGLWLLDPKAASFQPSIIPSARSPCRSLVVKHQARCLHHPRALFCDAGQSPGRVR